MVIFVVNVIILYVMIANSHLYYIKISVKVVKLYLGMDVSYVT